MQCLGGLNRIYGRLKEIHSLLSNFFELGHWSSALGTEAYFNSPGSEASGLELEFTPPILLVLNTSDSDWDYTTRSLCLQFAGGKLLDFSISIIT